jgi:hypothetical protein
MTKNTASGNISILLTFCGKCAQRYHSAKKSLVSLPYKNMLTQLDSYLASMQKYHIMYFVTGNYLKRQNKMVLHHFVNLLLYQLHFMYPGINLIKLWQKANGEKCRVASKLQFHKHGNQHKFCMKMFCAFLSSLLSFS